MTLRHFGLQESREVLHHLRFKLRRSVVAFPAGNDVHKVVDQHEGDTLSFEAKLTLVVSQEVTKVNVEKLACFLDHDIIVMSVADAQHICSHTVTSTGKREVLNGMCESAQ